MADPNIVVPPNTTGVGRSIKPDTRGPHGPKSSPCGAAPRAQSLARMPRTGGREAELPDVGAVRIGDRQAG
jgi:hypothetical protein